MKATIFGKDEDDGLLSIELTAETPIDYENLMRWAELGYMCPYPDNESDNCIDDQKYFSEEGHGGLIAARVWVEKGVKEGAYVRVPDIE